MKRNIAINRSGFICPGLENGLLSIGEKKYGKKVYHDGRYMYLASKLNQKEEDSMFLKMPFGCTFESSFFQFEEEDFGKRKGYIYQNVKELNQILETTYSSDMSEEIRKFMFTKDIEEKVMLRVEGPFSVLCQMIDMMKILKIYKRNPDFIILILDHIADFLAQYIIDVINMGVNIISLADPSGSSMLLGDKYYQELCGKPLKKMLKNIVPYTKHSLIHLCGRCSNDLEKNELIHSKKKKFIGSYGEALNSMSENTHITMIGHGCVNVEKKKIKEIYVLEFEKMEKQYQTEGE